jgi:hypothetical protein
LNNFFIAFGQPIKTRFNNVLGSIDFPNIVSLFLTSFACYMYSFMLFLSSLASVVVWIVNSFGKDILSITCFVRLSKLLGYHALQL